tara:strand:- start:4104 stop:4346 length:243 start_codon:yes stop_codon:yes gene_type:complete
MIFPGWSNESNLLSLTFMSKENATFQDHDVVAAVVPLMISFQTHGEGEETDGIVMTLIVPSDSVVGCDVFPCVGPVAQAS